MAAAEMQEGQFPRSLHVLRSKVQIMTVSLGVEYNQCNLKTKLRKRVKSYDLINLLQATFPSNALSLSLFSERSPY